MILHAPRKLGTRFILVKLNPAEAGNKSVTLPLRGIKTPSRRKEEGLIAESRRLPVTGKTRATVCKSGRGRPRLETVAQGMNRDGDELAGFHAAINSRVSAKIAA